jgi:hypothetical protein
MLRVDGPFDGVIERTLEVLGLLDIPYSQGYGPKVRPMYARLYGYQVSSYDVEAGGYRVLLEHRPADGTAPDEGITFLRTGPIGPANHARILQFVESYNALADEVKGPELVVWTERSRRRPANAGEGFNSSGTVTSDAEEEVR